MKKIRLFLYFLLVLFLFAAVMFFMETETGTPYSELDFVTYDALYSPEELHSLSGEEASAGYTSWDYHYSDREFSRVRTSRLVLKLTPGETYGIYSKQLTYAANLWVDGVQLLKLGTVTPSPEGFVPRTASAVVYFTAGEETEIVLQRCNFCHARWNSGKMFIGPQDVITRQVQNEYFRVTVVLAFLFTIALVNLGLFTGMPEQKSILWFGLSCLSAMLYQSLVDPKQIMLLIPDLGWYAGFRMEKWSLILMFVFTVLFLNSYFSGFLPKWFTGASVGLVLATGVVMLVLPTAVYTEFIGELEAVLIAVSILYCAGLFVSAVKNRRTIKRRQKYSLAGILIFLVCAVCRALDIGPLHNYMIELGLVLFELMITLTLAAEFSELKQAYRESQENEARLRSMNEAMEETQKLQENFMAVMNHEMRTPLAVIAGYAALEGVRLQGQEPADENLLRSLELIKQEALRLGRIVEQSDEGWRATVVNGQTETVPVDELFAAA